MPATSTYFPPSMASSESTPGLPDLEKFRTNLIKGMAAKRMSGSDVARAVWGSKTNAQGRQVARNRDRMTWYLAGRGYPRPETVAKLAEVLDLDPADLEREYDKATVTVAVTPGAGKTNTTYDMLHAAAVADLAQPATAFEFKVRKFGRVFFSYNKEVDMRLAMLLFDAIRAVDPDFSPSTPVASEDDEDPSPSPSS